MYKTSKVQLCFILSFSHTPTFYDPKCKRILHASLGASNRYFWKSSSFLRNLSKEIYLKIFFEKSKKTWTFFLAATTLHSETDDSRLHQKARVFYLLLLPSLK